MVFKKHSFKLETEFPVIINQMFWLVSWDALRWLVGLPPGYYIRPVAKFTNLRNSHSENC